MHRKTALVLATLLIAGLAQANIPDTFSPAYADNCGRFTVAPGGGENLHDPPTNLYRITAQVININGDPIPNIAATDCWLLHEALQTCPGQFSQADHDTDENGQTEFSGTIYSGLAGDASNGVDCNDHFLFVYILGIVINEGYPVCVATDSPDLNGDGAVSVADFGKYAVDFNCLPGDCDPCHDYNEDSFNNVADFAMFAGYYNASVCP